MAFYNPRGQPSSQKRALYLRIIAAEPWLTDLLIQVQGMTPPEYSSSAKKNLLTEISAEYFENDHHFNKSFNIINNLLYISADYLKTPVGVLLQRTVYEILSERSKRTKYKEGDIDNDSKSNNKYLLFINCL